MVDIRFGLGKAADNTPASDPADTNSATDAGTTPPADQAAAAQPAAQTPATQADPQAVTAESSAESPAANDQLAAQGINITGTMEESAEEAPPAATTEAAPTPTEENATVPALEAETPTENSAEASTTEAAPAITTPIAPIKLQVANNAPQGSDATAESSAENNEKAAQDHLADYQKDVSASKDLIASLEQTRKDFVGLLEQQKQHISKLKTDRKNLDKAINEAEKKLTEQKTQFSSALEQIQKSLS